MSYDEEVFTRYEIDHYYDQARVRMTTNDDNDDGYVDTEVVSCDFRPFIGEQALIEALCFTGAPRIGFAGHRVSVVLNGEELTSARYFKLVSAQS